MNESNSFSKIEHNNVKLYVFHILIIDANPISDKEHTTF